jgi:hypothetical protein
MERVNREQQIERWLSRSSLLVYLLVWMFVPVIIAGPQYWPVGFFVGFVYVTMHWFEQRFRGHCFLSADSTAFPAALLAALLTFFVMYTPQQDDPGLTKAFFALPLAAVAGHITAFLYVLLLDRLLDGVLRKPAMGEGKGQDGPN